MISIQWKHGATVLILTYCTNGAADSNHSDLASLETTMQVGVATGGVNELIGVCHLLAIVHGLILLAGHVMLDNAIFLMALAPETEDHVEDATNEVRSDKSATKGRNRRTEGRREDASAAIRVSWVSCTGARWSITRGIAARDSSHTHHTTRG